MPTAVKEQMAAPVCERPDPSHGAAGWMHGWMDDVDAPPAIVFAPDVNTQRLVAFAYGQAKSVDDILQTIIEVLPDVNDENARLATFCGMLSNLTGPLLAALEKASRLEARSTGAAS